MLLCCVCLFIDVYVYLIIYLLILIIYFKYSIRLNSCTIACYQFYMDKQHLHFL